MKIIINKIATIRSGYTFRGAVKEKPSSGVRMLQIKDVRNEDIVNIDKLIEIDWQGKEQLPILQENEIVVIARGLDNTAALMTQTSNVIPSNQLLIISIKAQSVLPQYLCWYLNRRGTQAQLKNMHMGTSIPSLSKKELGALPISVPDLQTQQKIIELDKLNDKQKTVYTELMNNSDMLLEGIVQQLLNGENK